MSGSSHQGLVVGTSRENWRSTRLTRRHVLQSKCVLGEGLFVSGDEVFWVDIDKDTLFHYDGSAVRTHALSHKVTVLLDRTGDRLVVASDAGIGEVSLADGRYHPIFDCAKQFRSKSHRTNDGCRLRNGDYLVGIMHRQTPESCSGAVFRITATGQVTSLTEDIRIPNTFIELPDGSVLVSDSAAGIVYKWRMESPGSFDTSVWYQAEEGAVPDGGCLLPDGYIAIAMWDASCIRLFDEAGHCIQSLNVGTPRPTNCKYSPVSRELWVTSASVGLEGWSADSSPLPGQTFSLGM